jgi:transposase
VIQVIEGGAAARAAARQFVIGNSTAIRWVKRHRETGSFEAKSNKGQSRSPLKRHEEWLLELVQREPDLTLEEIQSRLLDKESRDWVDLAVLPPPRHQLQKKACVPASRIGLTWRQRARPGRTCKLSSIPSVSSASRRPAPQLTWPAYVAALRVAAGLEAAQRTSGTSDALNLSWRSGISCAAECGARDFH